MIKFSVLLAGLLWGFLISPAHAGRLGVCYECEYDAYGQGLIVYNWSGSGFVTNNLDISGRLRCGGGASPRNISRAPAQMCDAAAGILRWENNDPFDPACSNGSGNHSFHLGGENLDLVVVGENGDSFRSGSFYRVQDGEKYSCQDDVRGGNNFSSLRYGRNRDLLDIYTVNAAGVKRNTYRIQDGSLHQIVSTPTSVGRLYGRNKDVISLYFVDEAGSISITDGIRIRDGFNYALTPLGNDIGVTYGRNHDVKGRFCFENGKWVSLLGSRNGAFPSSCTPPPQPANNNNNSNQSNFSDVLNCGRGTNIYCP